MPHHIAQQHPLWCSWYSPRQRAVLQRCCARSVVFLVPTESPCPRLLLHRIKENLEACKADYPTTSKEEILPSDSQDPSLPTEVGFGIARTASPEKKELHTNKYLCPAEGKRMHFSCGPLLRWSRNSPLGFTDLIS